MTHWLYVSTLLINNISTIDYAVVKSRDECIIKGREHIAVLNQQNIPWKLFVKCFPLPEGKDV